MAEGMASMLARQILVVPVVTSIFFLSYAAGDQLRYYQQNGITYCETLRTVQRPVCETKMLQTTRTVYKEQFYTETKDVTQVYWYPVTTYQAETNWVGRWESFCRALFRNTMDSANLLAATNSSSKNAGHLPATGARGAKG